MSRISKADEATSWRRPMPNNDSHSSSKQNDYSRRDSYSGHSSTRSQHPVHLQPPQPPADRQPILTEFSIAEAQAVLERRWAETLQQGLQPTCQCQQQQQAAADGEHQGGAGQFLQSLKQAVEQSSADAAWDD